MNERIKELMKQADYNAPGGRWKEYFAELIIGHATECVRDVLRDENSDLSHAAASQVQRRIKEYFGLDK